MFSCVGAWVSWWCVCACVCVCVCGHRGKGYGGKV